MRRILNFLRSPAGLFVIGVVVTIGLAVGVVLALQRTGDPQAVSDNAPLIAAVIALGGVGTAQMVSIALDNRRSQQTRDLEAQRASEAALQNYFEQVGKLLADPDRPLRRSVLGDSLSTVVRAQTLAVLEGLDPDRKRILLRFLYESELILKDKPIVSLAFANLRAANLRLVDLKGTNLSDAILIRADLSDAFLSGANLSGAFLTRADLRGASLSDTNLSEAYLTEADLRKADLIGANLTGTKLRDAIMPDGQKYRDWLNDKK